MELLQKLTLYDLVGYALPGTIFWCLTYWDEINNKLPLTEEGSLKGWVLLILIGYVTGILISEIAERILKKIPARVTIQEFMGELAISEDAMSVALKKANILSDGEKMNASILKKCIFPIYANIQTDSSFYRLHNYASAALLYKNMAIVFAVYACIMIWNMDIKCIFGILGTILFYGRCKRFDEKKVGYALCWFVQKYGGNKNSFDAKGKEV